MAALAPLCGSAITSDVRCVAAAALPALTGCVRVADRERGGRGQAALGPLLFALDALLEAIAEEAEQEPLEAVVQALGACVEAACRIEQGDERVTRADQCAPLLEGSRLPPEALCRALHACLAATLQRRAVRAAEATLDADYDDEQCRADAQAGDADGSLLFHVGEAVGSVLRTHGVRALSGLHAEWLPRLTHMADPRCVENDRRFATFVLCDVVERARRAETLLEETPLCSF